MHSNGRRTNMLYNITKISFSVDNQKIIGSLLQPKILIGKRPTIIFVHGWGSSEDKYILRAQPIADLGYICLTFSMRGHGKSEGNIRHLSRRDHLNDCLSAYDFLVKQKHVDKTRISVIGSSYGGYMASLAVSKRNFECLALKSPANYPDEGFAEKPAKDCVVTARLKQFRTNPVTAKENQALKSISAFHGNILVIEAEKDEVIPRQCLVNYVNALPNKEKLTYVIMKNADHASTTKEWNKQFVRILRDWFEKWVK